MIQKPTFWLPLCAVFTVAYCIDPKMMLVQFDHVSCVSRSGSVGTCYPITNCLKQGGRPSGSCLYGLAVCCEVQKTCNSTSSANVVQFVNPSYPKLDTEASVCSFILQAYKKTTCQLRLDFEYFELPFSKQKEETEDAPSCDGDEFIVKPNVGGMLGFSKLCGNNTGQHMYIPVDTSLGPTSVQFTVITSGKTNYKWNIRVTQVDCTKDPEKVAPSGCLQYHSEDRGAIKSLGNAQGYQGDLSYAVCVRRSVGSCGINYSSQDGKFKLGAADESVSTGEEGCDPSYDMDNSSSNDTWISRDYVLIPEGQVTGADVRASKLCGDFMSGNSVKSVVPGPFILYFHSDDKRKSSEDEQGFSMNYEQLSSC